MNSEMMHFAKDTAPARPGLEAIVEEVRPTVLIGVTGVGRIFSRRVLELMGSLNERPLIMALSNPTSRAECTPEEAGRASGGRALYCSGSPFDPVRVGDYVIIPNQANNAYIFPGLTLGIVAGELTRVPQELFPVAAEVVSSLVPPEELLRGRLYPPLTEIVDCSMAIGAAVMGFGYRTGLSTLRPRPVDLQAFLRQFCYNLKYTPTVPKPFTYEDDS